MLLAEVRLAYSHVVVLDSFFGKAEREPLLSQMTESGWDHAQVSIAPGCELPKACSQGMPRALPQHIAQSASRHFTGVIMALVD